MQLSASRESLSTINPVRQLTENQFLEPIAACEKDLLKIAIGDPAIFGNLPPPPAVTEALHKAVENQRNHGIAHSAGIPEVRESVARQLSKYPTNHPLSAEDVLMTVGTHGALEISIRVLCEPESTVLLPSPCYPCYQTFTGAAGIKSKFYSLLPEKGWEVNLNDLERQMEATPISALVINNPSNPCGSVYSKQHLLDVLAIAERHRVPVIADEVYADMVFKGQEFHPIGALSENVPVLTCGSISKRFLVPGWRCGWLVMHDRHGVFSNSVKAGLKNFLTKMVTPPAVIQAAIPDMLKNTPESFFMATMEVFENNAHMCYSRLKDVPGITPVLPTGAMYMMVRINLPSFPEFKDDVEFMKGLIREQGVVGLPGSIFKYPGAMRIVLIMPQDKLDIACNRIAQFCSDHYKV